MANTELKRGETRITQLHGWYSAKKRTFVSDWDSATEGISHRGMVKVVMHKRQEYQGDGRWLTESVPVKVVLADGTHAPDYPTQENPCGMEL